LRGGGQPVVCRAELTSIHPGQPVPEPLASALVISSDLGGQCERVALIAKIVRPVRPRIRVIRGHRTGWVSGLAGWVGWEVRAC